MDLNAAPAPSPIGVRSGGTCPAGLPDIDTGRRWAGAKRSPPQVNGPTAAERNLFAGGEPGGLYCWLGPGGEPPAVSSLRRLGTILLGQETPVDMIT